MINNNRLLDNESSGRGSGQIIWRNLVFTMYRNISVMSSSQFYRRGGRYLFVCSHISLWPPKNCLQEIIFSQIAHVIGRCWTRAVLCSSQLLSADFCFLSSVGRYYEFPLNTSRGIWFNLFPIKFSDDFDKLGTMWKPAAGNTLNKQRFPRPGKSVCLPGYHVAFTAYSFHVSQKKLLPSTFLEIIS